MYWNHRVFRHYDELNEPYYTVHEVYYNDDDSIMGYTEKESPWSEDLDGLRYNLECMLSCLDKPVLDIKELEEYFEWCRENPEYGPEEPHVTYDSIEEFLEALDGE